MLVGKSKGRDILQNKTKGIDGQVAMNQVETVHATQIVADQ